MTGGEVIILAAVVILGFGNMFVSWLAKDEAETTKHYVLSVHSVVAQVRNAVVTEKDGEG